jgi:hypothetical protein
MMHYFTQKIGSIRRLAAEQVVLFWLDWHMQVLQFMLSMFPQRTFWVLSSFDRIHRRMIATSAYWSKT